MGIEKNFRLNSITMSYNRSFQSRTSQDPAYESGPAGPAMKNHHPSKSQPVEVQPAWEFYEVKMDGTKTWKIDGRLGILIPSHIKSIGF